MAVPSATPESLSKQLEIDSLGAGRLVCNLQPLSDQSRVFGCQASPTSTRRFQTAPSSISGNLAEVDSWADGDGYQIYNLTSVNLVTCYANGCEAIAAPIGTYRINVMATGQPTLTFGSPVGGTQTNVWPVTVESSIGKVLVAAGAMRSQNTYNYRGAVSGGAVGAPGAFPQFLAGALLPTIALVLAGTSLDVDVVLGGVQFSTIGACSLGNVYLESTATSLSFGGGSAIEMGTDFAGNPASLWGAAN